MRYKFKKRYKAVSGTWYYQWRCKDNKDEVRIPVEKFRSGAPIRIISYYQFPKHILDGARLVTYG
jgi:hypothetical protein